MRLAIRGSHGQPDVVVGHDEAELRQHLACCGDTLPQCHRMAVLKVISFLHPTRNFGLTYVSAIIEVRVNDTI